MGVESWLFQPSFPSNSIRFKLLLVVITLLCETWILHTAAEDGNIGHPVTNGEIAEEIGNPATADTGEMLHSFRPIGTQNDDDLETYKRHLGSAIAALSGSKPISGSRFFASPSKKHVGSIAAQAPGRSFGKKLELLIPSAKNELYKRHIGALRAVSGFKQKPLTRSVGESSEFQMNPHSSSYELETAPMSYLMNSQSWIKQGGTSDTGTYDSNIISPEEIQSRELFLDVQPPTRQENWLLRYSNDPSLGNDFMSSLGMTLPQSEATVTEELLDQNVGGTVEDVGAYKSKRFLGPLARGGWFPRHFRGVISDSSFGKRHIGSLARLGWMPNAKANTRLTLLDEQRGEIGLKRNDVSPRRRMFYHFTAPSLWTSPRGK